MGKTVTDSTSVYAVVMAADFDCPDSMLIEWWPEWPDYWPNSHAWLFPVRSFRWSFADADPISVWIRHFLRIRRLRHHPRHPHRSHGIQLYWLASECSPDHKSSTIDTWRCIFCGSSSNILGTERHPWARSCGRSNHIGWTIGNAYEWNCVGGCRRRASRCWMKVCGATMENIDWNQ